MGIGEGAFALSQVHGEQLPLPGLADQAKESAGSGNSAALPSLGAVGPVSENPVLSSNPRRVPPHPGGPWATAKSGLDRTHPCPAQGLPQDMLVAICIKGFRFGGEDPRSGGWAQSTHPHRGELPRGPRNMHVGLHSACGNPNRSSSLGSRPHVLEETLVEPYTPRGSYTPGQALSGTAGPDLGPERARGPGSEGERGELSRRTQGPPWGVPTSLLDLPSVLARVTQGGPPPCSPHPLLPRGL